LLPGANKSPKKQHTGQKCDILENKKQVRAIPWKTASEIKLSEKQERILIENAVGTHTLLHIKTRSQIILNAAKGWHNNTIEENMGIDPKTVKNGVTGIVRVSRS
jgi:DNA-binding NarL/FixJ family response regulator